MQLKISSILSILIILDVLFLPYPPGIPVTFGVILAPIWLLFSLRKKQNYTLVAGIILILTVFLSLLYTAAFNLANGAYFFNAVINSGVLLYMTLLAILAHSAGGVGSQTFLFILKCYIFFVTVLAALFVIDPFLYFQTRSFWTYNNNTIEFDGLDSTTRFTGTMSDPNNAIVIVTAVLAYVLFRQPERIWNNVLLIAGVCVIAVCAMSATGAICLTGTVSIYYIFAGFSNNKSNSIILKFVILTLVFSGLIAASSYIFKSELFQLYIYRLEASDIGSRFSRWGIIYDLQKTASSFLIGDGGVIIWNGSAYKPHNGHFHVYYNYGIFAYISFIYLFFPFVRISHWEKYVFLAPLLLGFTVNVGVYEPRFAGIWALLVGMMRFHEIRISHIKRNLREDTQTI